MPLDRYGEADAILNNLDPKTREMAKDVERARTTRIGAPTPGQSSLMNSTLQAQSAVGGDAKKQGTVDDAWREASTRIGVPGAEDVRTMQLGLGVEPNKKEKEKENKPQGGVGMEGSPSITINKKVELAGYGIEPQKTRKPTGSIMDSLSRYF